MRQRLQEDIRFKRIEQGSNRKSSRIQQLSLVDQFQCPHHTDVNQSHHDSKDDWEEVKLPHLPVHRFDDSVHEVLHYFFTRKGRKNNTTIAIRTTMSMVRTSFCSRSGRSMNAFMYSGGLAQPHIQPRKVGLSRSLQS